MPNTYISQRDQIDIVTYEVLRRYFPVVAERFLSPRLSWVAEKLDRVEAEQARLDYMTGLA